VTPLAYLWHPAGPSIANLEMLLQEHSTPDDGAHADSLENEEESGQDQPSEEISPGVRQSGARHTPRQLFMLFHGEGDAPQDVQRLGNKLAKHFPQSCVLLVRAPHACAQASEAYEWFSVQGLSDHNRPQRCAQALPGFLATVQLWQERLGVGAQATALIGFSQGAEMALASTQVAEPALVAARVIALSGRFASPPERAHAGCTIHLIHGKLDAQVHYSHTVLASRRLQELGADVTADIFPDLDHRLSSRVRALVVHRLTQYIPKRYLDQV
jgi:phospholipase/carboxylesterase